VPSATYATVAVFVMELSREADQRRGLDEVIVPGVRGTPGVVSGCWALDREASVSTVVITFDSEESARLFADNVRANAANQQTIGIKLRSISVAEVLATV
jgi:hypothetical protein